MWSVGVASHSTPHQPAIPGPDMYDTLPMVSELWDDAEKMEPLEPGPATVDVGPESTKPPVVEPGTEGEALTEAEAGDAFEGEEEEVQEDDALVCPEHPEPKAASPSKDTVFYEAFLPPCPVPVDDYPSKAISPAEQVSQTGAQRGRGKGRGRGRGRGKGVSEKAEASEPKGRPKSKASKPAAKPKAKAASKAKAKAKAACKRKAKAACKPKAKAKAKAETGAKAKARKGHEGNEELHELEDEQPCKKAKAEPTKSLKRKANDAEPEATSTAKAAARKALLSRKSAAYHRAVKEARELGKTQEQCKEAGKDAP